MYKYQVIYVKNLFKRLLQYIMFLHFCTQFLVYQGIAVSHIPSDWHRHPSHVFTVNVQLVKHLWYQCKKKKKTYALSLFSLWQKQVAPNSNALSKRMGTEWAVVKKAVPTCRHSFILTIQYPQGQNEEPVYLSAGK